MDDIPKDIPGPYTYVVDLLGGDSFEMVYDIEDALANPPQQPATAIEEALDGSPEYYQWKEWLRFQEALDHQSKMFEGYAEYCERVAVYVRENCLPDDVQIETAEDWEAIYNAALCPQVTLEDIKTAMAHNFGATWGGKQLFDALANVEGGLGEYVSTKVWDTELMVRLGETEEAFSERSIKSRARMIAALKIPEFFRILESDKSLKEMKTSGN